MYISTYMVLNITLKYFFKISIYIIVTLPAFQLRSLGILPFCANNTITAAVTFITTLGGDPNDFNSVKFDLFNVFKASYMKINKNIVFQHFNSCELIQIHKKDNSYLNNR